MTRDKTVGAAQQTKGTVKEPAVTAIGDTRLEPAGKIDGLWARIQNSLNGLRAAITGK